MNPKDFIIQLSDDDSEDSVSQSTLSVHLIVRFVYRSLFWPNFKDAHLHYQWNIYIPSINLTKFVEGSYGAAILFGQNCSSIVKCCFKIMNVVIKKIVQNRWLCAVNLKYFAFHKSTFLLKKSYTQVLNKAPPPPPPLPVAYQDPPFINFQV